MSNPLELATLFSIQLAVLTKANSSSFVGDLCQTSHSVKHFATHLCFLLLLQCFITFIRYF